MHACRLVIARLTFLTWNPFCPKEPHSALRNGGVASAISFINPSAMFLGKPFVIAMAIAV